MLDLLGWTKGSVYVVELPVGLGVKREFFTKIPFGEFKRLKQAIAFLSMPQHEIEMHIYRQYTLPEKGYTYSDIEQLPAGFVTTISELILRISDSGTLPDENGNVDKEALTQRVNGQRYRVFTSVELQIYTVICAVFKAYTFQMLEELPWDKILCLFAAAEKYLLDTGAFREPVEFIETKPVNEPAKPEPVKLNRFEEEDEFSDSEDDFMYMAKAAAKASVKPEVKAPVPTPRVEAAKPISVPVDDKLAVKVRTTNPQKSRLEELEAKRVATIAAARAGQKFQKGYVAPKDQQTQAGGTTVTVPGIRHNETLDDFFDENIPLMTEEEAMAMARDLELEPAGYDEELRARILKKKNKEDAAIKSIGNKRLTLKQLKKLKQNLNE